MQELNLILEELRMQGTKPLAIHVDSPYTYIIYGALTFKNGIASITGYPILRVNEISANSTALDQGLLLESDRNNVDVKNDYASFITLMSSITFG